MCIGIMVKKNSFDWPKKKRILLTMTFLLGGGVEENNSPTLK